jgi:two-component sensor histidine kinase
MVSFVKPHSRWTGIWRSYLFVGAATLVLVSLIYTMSLIRKLEEEPKIMSRVFARFCMTAAVPEVVGDVPETGIIFEEIIQKINFPVVVTDKNGVPLAWKNIGVEPFPMTTEQIRQWDSLKPDDPLMGVKKVITSLDGDNDPIPMMLNSDSTVVGYVHYGHPQILKELSYIPFIQIGMIALFVWIGFIGFRAIKAGEERAVWVGLAREAAHQLGTPISSLMGWLALLKDGTKTAPEIIPEMENDLAHLEKVLNRFNQVGSIPKLAETDINQLLQGAAGYFTMRAANMGKSIRFEEYYDRDVKVMLNRDLFTWAVENLIKNAIDAIDSSDGLISIRTTVSGKKIEVIISDNGRGIQTAHQKKIFSPGFTTKTLGWGLGLSLVRRIIEDYHQGRVRLVNSRVGQGSVFMIVLPLAKSYH